MKNQFAGDTGDNGNYYSAHHQSKHEANIILEPQGYGLFRHRSDEAILLHGNNG